MDYQTEYITALIGLHRGLDRQGPGDADLSQDILSSLTALPSQPQIADLGCGSGAGALLLAQHFQSRVMAVDFSSDFIKDLQVRAKTAGLEHLITPICGDMANLNWPRASIDLLWSEGAAYNLGFEKALHLWRPLLTDNGIAVISEISWWLGDVNNVPKAAIAYWQAAYPHMGTEAKNIERANRAGFRVLSTRRLASAAWWSSYYYPLRQRFISLESNQAMQSPAMQAVIHETKDEMALFEQFSEFYGYTFYVLQVAECR